MLLSVTSNKFNEKVPRSLIFITVIILLGCSVNKNYGKEYVLEIKKDINGVIVFKKIRQLYVTRNGEEYFITTYQEFDSSGRIKKIYGFEQGGRGSKIITRPGPNDKYLKENFYKGDHLYISNTYSWPTKSDSNFTPNPQILVNQTFNPYPGYFPYESFTTLITESGDKVSFGIYQRSQTKSQETYEIKEWYEFEITTSQMQFTSDGRFKIENAKKIKDFL